MTEAGTLYRGTIKSAIGIGSLLLDGIGDTLRFSFVLSLQYAHYTLLLLLGTVTLTLLQIFVFPMALVLVLPGVWCWCSSFLLEKAMSRYSPQKKVEF